MGGGGGYSRLLSHNYYTVIFFTAFGCQVVRAFSCFRMHKTCRFIKQGIFPFFLCCIDATFCNDLLGTSFQNCLTVLHVHGNRDEGQKKRKYMYMTNINSQLLSILEAWIKCCVLIHLI